MSVTQIFRTQAIEGFPSRNQFCFRNAGPNVMFDAVQVEDGHHARAVRLTRGVCLLAVGAQTGQSCRNQNRISSLKLATNHVFKQKENFLPQSAHFIGSGRIGFRNSTSHI